MRKQERTKKNNNSEDFSFFYCVFYIEELRTKAVSLKTVLYVFFCVCEEI